MVLIVNYEAKVKLLPFFSLMDTVSSFDLLATGTFSTHFSFLHFPPQLLFKASQTFLPSSLYYRVCSSLFWLSLVRDLCGCLGDCSSGSLTEFLVSMGKTCGYAFRIQGIIFESIFSGFVLPCLECSKT